MDRCKDWIVGASPTWKPNIMDHPRLCLWRKSQVSVLVQRYQQHHMKSSQHPQATWDTQQLNKSEIWRPKICAGFFLFFFDLKHFLFHQLWISLQLFQLHKWMDPLGCRICAVREASNSSALKINFTLTSLITSTFKSSVIRRTFWRSYVDLWPFWPWRSQSVLPWMGYHPKAPHPERIFHLLKL